MPRRAKHVNIQRSANVVGIVLAVWLVVVCVFAYVQHQRWQGSWAEVGSIVHEECSGASGWYLAVVGGN